MCKRQRNNPFMKVFGLHLVLIFLRARCLNIQPPRALISSYIAWFWYPFHGKWRKDYKIAHTWTLTVVYMTHISPSTINYLLESIWSILPFLLYISTIFLAYDGMCLSALNVLIFKILETTLHSLVQIP